MVIAPQRTSIFQMPAADQTVRPPGKNWPQDFYKRHPELKSERVKALDWARHDHSIYGKITSWFTVASRELCRPEITPEIVYDLDETGVLLKVLVSKDDFRDDRGNRLPADVSDGHGMYFCRWPKPKPNDRLAHLYSPQHLDHTPHSRLAFCMLEDGICRYCHMPPLPYASYGCKGCLIHRLGHELRVSHGS